jgi:hypothetical protein
MILRSFKLYHEGAAGGAAEIFTENTQKILEKNV